MQDEINGPLASIHEQQGDQPGGTTPEEDMEPLERAYEPEVTETIHVYFVRETERKEQTDEQLIESTITAGSTTPTPETHPRPAVKPKGKQRAVLLGLLALGLLISIGMVLCYFVIQLTPTATVTLIPAERDITATATLSAVPGTPGGNEIQGRLLPTFTLTQTTTALATGKGHQDAQDAVGFLTFFNGFFAWQTVAAGTRLAGSDGVQVVTDQAATIPAGNPPTYGQVTVMAHAARPGPQGNIRAGDINIPCCLPSVLAKNLNAFQGGQNTREYTYVTREDIDNAASTLKAALAHSEVAALAAQLTSGEALVPPTCTSTVSSDRQPGEETTAVGVTVSEQCMAVAYESVALQERAISILTAKAQQQLGTHYSLIGAIQVSALQAMITDQRRGRASIAVTVDGTWTYQFSQQELQWIKQLIAGETQQQAIRVLLGLPGIQQATIEGIGESQHLPKESSRIQIRMLYGEVSSVMSNRHWLLE